MKYITTIDGKKYEVEIGDDGAVSVNGKPRSVDFLALGPALYSIIMDTQQHEIVVESHENEFEVLLNGRLYTSTVMDEREQLILSRRGGMEDATGEIIIRAPMPGLLVDVLVKEGDAVAAGQTVVILESMKMQNELKSPRAGTVQRVSVQTGQTVEMKKVLITLT